MKSFGPWALGSVYGIQVKKRKPGNVESCRPFPAARMRETGCCDAPHEGKFRHPDTPDAPHGGKYRHPDTPDTPLGGKFRHPDTPDAPNGGKFRHPDTPDAPHGGKFRHPDTPDAPLGGKFRHSGSPKTFVSNHFHQFPSDRRVSFADLTRRPPFPINFAIPQERPTLITDRAVDTLQTRPVAQQHSPRK